MLSDISIYVDLEHCENQSPKGIFFDGFGERNDQPARSVPLRGVVSSFAALRSQTSSVRSTRYKLETFRISGASLVRPAISRPNSAAPTWHRFRVRVRHGNPTAIITKRFKSFARWIATSAGRAAAGGV
ncbi:hypothetical protein [Burkholderia gladioli]|uniref:hypothetical protein n=1 Tax=Burkholderia gladioli TaxID=28095 RepID=UPI001C5EB7AD|nr:hypothetical protein [Burkholderia gladioli]MBW5280749.1 hypothetical protein [Burkholderia gladioli]